MSLIGVLMYNLRDIAILNIHGANYSCIISGISQSETMNLTQNVDFSEKKWNIINYKSYLFLKQIKN